MDQGAFGRNLASRFGLSEAPAIIARTPTKTQIAVTELRSDRPKFGKTKPIPREDAFLVGLQLRDFPDHQYWEDGRKAQTYDLTAGDMLIHDLKRDPAVLIDKPFHSIHFYLPRATLDAIADDANAGRIADLRYQPGVGLKDGIVNNLGTSMLPAFRHPERVSQIFVDNVALAVAAHVAHTYGGLRSGSQEQKGGLAAWQVRKAKELLAANLDGSVALSDVASACRLSASHFSRAFRHSTGLPPHQWLLHRRIEAAKPMLRRADVPLTEVALACGFADQSHFTRVFTRSIGTSPGAWRRASGS